MEADLVVVICLFPDEVIHLIGICLLVVEFIHRVQEVYGQLVPAIENGPHELYAAEAIVVNFIAGKFRNDIVIGPDLGMIYFFQQAFPFKTFWNGQAHIFQDKRREIDVADRVGIRYAQRHPGTGDQQGNPC